MEMIQVLKHNGTFGYKIQGERSSEKSTNYDNFFCNLPILKIVIVI